MADFIEWNLCLKIQKFFFPSFLFRLLQAAIRAARRVNDYTLATRVVDALKYKCPTPRDFESYLTELKPVMTELGVDKPDDLRF